MTLVRRALFALCIALATALAVASLVLIDANSRPADLDTLYRN